MEHPPTHSDPASAPRPVVQKAMSARAWGLLLLLAGIWGTSFLANKVALTEIGALSTVAGRVLGAGLVLWAWVLWRGLAVPTSPRALLGYLGMGILNNALPFSLITWGQKTIPSGLAGILNSTTAILGVLVAALVFRDERLTARKSIGITIGFAGVVTVIGLSALARLDITSLSQLALIGAALSYALSGSFARVALRGIAPEVAAAGMLAASSLIMVPLALIVEGPPALHHAAPVWLALGWLAFVSTAIAYLLFYQLLALAGAGNAALTTLLVAPVAVLLGTLVAQETLAPRAFAGFGLIALGLVVLDGRLLPGQVRRATPETP